jgi:hypothetical protein
MYFSFFFFFFFFFFFWKKKIMREDLLGSGPVSQPQVADRYSYLRGGRVVPLAALTPVYDRKYLVRYSL